MHPVPVLKRLLPERNVDERSLVWNREDVVHEEVQPALLLVDLRDQSPNGVVSIGLYPGIVRTERILAKKDELPFDLSMTESAEFTGRVIAAVFADSGRMKHSGAVRVVAELAEEYGVVDVDGSQPRSLRRPK